MNKYTFFEHIIISMAIRCKLFPQDWMFIQLAHHLTSESDCNSPKKRLANWDLLRSLSMFSVIVVHSSGQLGPILGIQTQGIIHACAIVCDPLFFALSGYFAIRPLKGTLGSYYLRKISTIILPLFVYSISLYLYTTGIVSATLPGYFEYLLDALTPWWFIPILIPFLIIAPFLYPLFEALDDRQLKFLLKLVLALTTWGIASSFLSWVFQTTGHATLERIVGIAGQILPAALLPNSYFPYFCLGYVLRRLMPQLSSNRKNQLIAIGAAAWILDVLFAYEGVSRADPSYPWMFVTIGMFIAFDRIAIGSPVAQKILSWTARRSYSIYLVQFTTIGIGISFIYNTLFQGAVGSLFAPARIGIWALSLVCSYVLALAAASLIDTTLLKAAQDTFDRITRRFTIAKS